MKTAIMAFEPSYRAGGEIARRDTALRSPRRPSLKLTRVPADVSLFHAWRA